MPIPSLLAVAAVHHHLIREGKRVRVGLVAESGDAREVADLALLIGFGAGAVNPYLAFETIAELVAGAARCDGKAPLDLATATKNYVNALKKGLLKVMSKMGISTIASYHGAQIFEAIGISTGRRSTRTSPAPRRRSAASASREIAARGTRASRRGASRPADARSRPRRRRRLRLARDRRAAPVDALDASPRCRRPCASNDAKSYAEYAALINDQAERPVTLRGLLDLVPAGPPVPLDEVEEARIIVHRFATGAMSFGSISKEAHENLADRDEPHRRSQQHRRGRRGRGALPPRRARRRAKVRRSSRSRAAASA